MGSDVFTVVSSRLWCWWSQTLPGIIPALPSWHQVFHWSPWDPPQIGWVVVFFSFASKVEEQVDHTVSSYPVSPMVRNLGFSLEALEEPTVGQVLAHAAHGYIPLWIPISATLRRSWELVEWAVQAHSKWTSYNFILVFLLG